MAEHKKLSKLGPFVDEKTAFENEKSLLQRSAVLAEQRASGLQELWRSCKADLAAARLSAAQTHELLAAERTKVRQIKDENVELQEKLSEKNEEIQLLLDKIQNLNEDINVMKNNIASKDEQIKYLDTEKKSLTISLSKKDEELKKKDAELHCEMLKTEELHEKVEQLAIQIQRLQTKLEKWPFSLAFPWMVPNTINSLCCSLTNYLYIRMQGALAILKFR